MIEVFKMFHGFEKINISDYLVVDQERRTRHTGFNIIGKSFRSEESKQFFFNRIVNVWNTHPAEIVTCNRSESFKTRLDKYLRSNPNINYFVPRQAF